MDGESPELPVYERFDFGDSGQVSSEQLRLLQSLDETLARNLTHALSAWLRTSVTVTSQEQAQRMFSEFLENTDDCCMQIISLPEFHANGLLRWPLALATQMIELLLGSTGAAQSEARELTEIEGEVFTAVLELTLRELNAVWAQIALSFGIGERARNGSERQLLPPAERVFCFAFQVDVGGASASISLCLAAPLLASVLRRASSKRRSLPAAGDAEMQHLLTCLREARVRTTLSFGPVSVPARHVSQLCAGSTLVLPLPSNTVAELRISDVPVAAAMPMRVGERRAAQTGVLRDKALHPALLPGVVQGALPGAVGSA